MVDRERVEERLSRLSTLLVRLEEIRAGGEEAYGRDWSLRLEAERALQLAVQICIDLGAHLIAELGLRAPSDNRGVFASLRDGGLIDDELATRLGDAAGLRNLLVHAYADLDDRRIWAALSRLDHLRAFAAVVAEQAERA